jgi:hypothetical protein
VKKHFEYKHLARSDELDEATSNCPGVEDGKLADNNLAHIVAKPNVGEHMYSELGWESR